jgi:hypothetical protein
MSKILDRDERSGLLCTGHGDDVKQDNSVRSVSANLPAGADPRALDVGREVIECPFGCVPDDSGRRS